MNPKLAVATLAGALSLSGCYYVPYGYGYYPGYPAYPGTPVVSTAQAQREVPLTPEGASGPAAAQAYNNAQASYSSSTPQYAAPAAPVVYAAPYPAYYPSYPASYPVYAPYPAYGYGYPYGYGYGGPSVSIGFGWWGGGGGHGGHYHR
jgi:hypothetical protein